MKFINNKWHIADPEKGFGYEDEMKFDYVPVRSSVWGWYPEWYYIYGELVSKE